MRKSIEIGTICVNFKPTKISRLKLRFSMRKLSKGHCQTYWWPRVRSNIQKQRFYRKMQISKIIENFSRLCAWNALFGSQKRCFIKSRKLRIDNASIEKFFEKKWTTVKKTSRMERKRLKMVTCTLDSLKTTFQKQKAIR